MVLSWGPEKCDPVPGVELFFLFLSPLSTARCMEDKSSKESGDLMLLVF